MGGDSSSKSRSRSPPSLLLSSCLLLVWFASSLFSTLVNKNLMDRFPYAVTLSAVHLSSSILVDICIISYRKLEFTKFRKDVFLACLPVALFINFGKTLTYVSYGLVPASLTHTAKASSPVFSVLVSKLLFNQVPSLATFLSLIPITIGVTLSALTEINWVFLGFLAAVCAALANVLNSTYTKKGLHSSSTSATGAIIAPPDPLIFHMYTACVAVVMLLPYAMLVEMPYITWRSEKLPLNASGMGVMSLEASIVPTDEAGASSSHTAHSTHAHHLFPWSSMFLSLILHYVQNISNIYFLSGVSVLTHQVAQSLKRLLNITGAVYYFGNRVTLMNAAGMGLALLGFSMYSAAKQKGKGGSSSHANNGVAMTSMRGGNNTPSYSNIMSTPIAQSSPHSPGHSQTPTTIGVVIHDHAHESDGDSSSAVAPWSQSSKSKLLMMNGNSGIISHHDSNSATSSPDSTMLNLNGVHPTAHAIAMNAAAAAAAQLQQVEEPQTDKEDDNFCV